MSVFFFDSSVLTKRYVIESGTTWVLTTVVANSGHHILIAQISPVEVFSAISRHKRENRISARTSRAIRVYLERHIFREYDVITLSDSIIQAAQDLLDKYTLRAYDAVQLASALDSNSKLLKASLALSPLSVPIHASTLSLSAKVCRHTFPSNSAKQQHTDLDARSRHQNSCTKLLQD